MHPKTSLGNEERSAGYFQPKTWNISHSSIQSSAWSLNGKLGARVQLWQNDLNNCMMLYVFSAWAATFLNISHSSIQSSAWSLNGKLGARVQLWQNDLNNCMMLYVFSAWAATFLKLFYAPCVRSQEVQGHRAQWHMQDGITQCFSEAMVKLLLAAQVLMGSVTFHPWMKDCHTARFLQEVNTQCFSELMVKLLLAAIILLDNAAFHRWMKDFRTARFLQEVATQCFSEVMVKLLLAAGILPDNATFHLWMKEFHTARFLQDIFTQCFSEVMVKVLLAAKCPVDNAAFHPWMKDFRTARFLQEITTQCFSEVMVKPEFWRAMQHSTLEWRTFLHPGFCRKWPHSASQKWWSSCCLRLESWRTMQHSTLGWRNLIRPSFCRRVAHSASEKWWSSCCLRLEWLWTLQYSIIEIEVLAWLVAIWLRTSRISQIPELLLYKWFHNLSWERPCGASGFSWGWWRCYTDLRRIGWAGGAAIESTKIWQDCGCLRPCGSWTEHRRPDSSNGFAWCTFAWYNIQSESIGNAFWCDASLSQNGKHTVAWDGRKKCEIECVGNPSFVWIKQRESKFFFGIKQRSTMRTNKNEKNKKHIIIAESMHSGDLT